MFEIESRPTNGSISVQSSEAGEDVEAAPSAAPPASSRVAVLKTPPKAPPPPRAPPIQITAARAPLPAKARSLITWPAAMPVN